MTGTISGAIIVLITFALGNTLPKNARNAFRLAMLARLSVSLLNVLQGGKMIGANADANRIYSMIVDASSNIRNLKWDIETLISSSITGFININALIQWALGSESFFLAHSFSLLGASLCLIFISKIWLLLVPTEHKRLPYILLIYSLLPSVLSFQSYILREVWQTLCILGIAWLSLQIRRHGFSVTKILQLLLIAAIGCILHRAMPIMMVVALFVGLWIESIISVTRWFMRQTRLFKYGFFLFMLLLFLSPLIIESNYFQFLFKGQLIQSIELYAEGGQGARAEYGKLFYPRRPWTIIPAFIAYQITPLPWQFGKIVDFVLFVENFFRIFLLISYFFYRTKLTQFHQDNMDMLILMWFLLELIWSLGTINWGTAARHHVTTVGLLLIVGVASRDLVTSELLYARGGQSDPSQ